MAEVRHTSQAARLSTHAKCPKHHILINNLHPRSKKVRVVILRFWGDNRAFLIVKILKEVDEGVLEVLFTGLTECDGVSLRDCTVESLESHLKPVSQSIRILDESFIVIVIDSIIVSFLQNITSISYSPWAVFCQSFKLVLGAQILLPKLNKKQLVNTCFLHHFHLNKWYN